MNNIFSFKRLWLGIRKSMLSGWKGLLTVFGAVAAFFVLISLPSAYKGETYPWFESLFLPQMIIGGLVTASIAFREYSDKNKNLRALTLPLSSLERFLERWVVHTPFFFLVILVFTFLASLLASGIGWLIFRNSVGIFNPFDAQIWKGLPYFLVVQSLFYLGSAWFRKAAFFKTLLVLSLLPLGFGLILALFLRIFMGTYIQGAIWGDMQDLQFSMGGMSPDIWEARLRFLIGLAKTLFWLILPFSYGISWLRLREKEVLHGV